VARNRLRRRLKELWRRRVQEGLPPIDLVIRTRRSAYGATFEELAGVLLAWKESL
jgi:ribonuclease P protein component